MFEPGLRAGGLQRINVCVVVVTQHASMADDKSAADTVSIPVSNLLRTTASLLDLSHAALVPTHAD